MASQQTELPLADAMNVDVATSAEAVDAFPPRSHSGQGRRSNRRRDWYRGRGGPYQHETRAQNADAMSTFTSFFRAEAKAKELATRKEAYAFNQQITVKVTLRLIVIVSAVPALELLVDQPLEHSNHLPATYLLPLIAAVMEEETRNPTVLPPPPVDPVPDPGRDVAEIVEAAERLDLENSWLQNSHHLKKQVPR
ncbi:uncharacterized protein HD556DRAFT_1309043 [Suillus plorans]|uniref:Uncharacterized protein n=1 Tax=Suillus plorans TaxID=116603 RepID=A0A9P7AN23_9AGAM|nr:uncharacterized protein HD556DRAFT_1309043 [Suillus plorans]KAG1792745.1 hypothetical protein HD556DRAFT_1309043 [Suillus plorans]